MLEVHAILHRQRCYENMTEKTGTLSDAYGKRTISGYKALEEELTAAYELAGTKLNHNKIVEIIKFLTNKRMVVQESRGIYRFMQDYHY